MFFRPLFASRLARFILGANVLALAILIVGMLVVSEMRRGLVDAKLDALRAEGGLIANILAEGAAEGDPAPRLIHDDARALLRQLYVPQETRVRVFGRDGLVVADSHLLADRVDVMRLPPLGDDSGLAAGARSLLGQALDGVAGVFRSAEQRAALERGLPDEVRLAHEGDIVQGVRRLADGSRVVSVSIPIQPVRAVVGVVTIESFDLEAIIAAERRQLFPFIAMAMAMTILTSLLLTVFIARPVRRLARAANEARLAGGKRVPMPSLGARKDEIGELGEALSAMTEALYDRIDAIERFAADVAHELKNPLTSIRSASEMLPNAQGPERQAKLLAIIAADVRRLDRLITDISRASRLDAELAREDVGRVVLKDLLGDLTDTYEAAGAAGGVRVLLDVRARETAIAGRAGPLGQVFRNIIDNAVTFSPPGGTVRIRLERGHRKGAPTLVALIDDDGPGIPPENLETVFERFYTERPKGAAFGAHSGLGLAIARQIVLAHDGLIYAQNRAEADGTIIGARFVVELPAARI